MAPVSENEVRAVAHYMGYDLGTFNDGFVLTRDWHSEQEVIVAYTLEEIADFLTH